MIVKYVAATLLVVALGFGQNAQAETASAAPSPTSQSTIKNTLQTIRNNTRASYTVWFQGPSARSLSGNTNGGGTNLLLDHYLGLSYRLPQNFSIGVTQLFRQYIDELPSEQQDPLEAMDPYLTLSNSRILRNERLGLNLSGYLRYYLPVSRRTRQSADALSQTEQGRGGARLFLAGSKSFADGAGNLTLNTYLQYRFTQYSDAERFNANGDSTRQDYSVLLSPNLSYAFTPKLEAYIEYGVLFRHTTDGKWTKFNNPAYGQYISPGLNISATRRLSVTPYASIGPVFRWKESTFGLIASYSLL